MEDTLALIRLLAETPNDVSPSERTRDLIASTHREHVVREGVIPEGNAVPPVGVKEPLPQTTPGTSAAPSRESKGIPISVAHSPNVLGRGVRWVIPTEHVHADVSPKPPEQSDGRPASPTPRRTEVLPTADPVTGLPSIDGKVEVSVVKPASVQPASVMSPETFFGKAATPSIIKAVEGIPAEVRKNQYVHAVASPTPTTTVSITVPPLFPVDPAQAFARVDEEMNIPPRQPSKRMEHLQSMMVSIPDDTLPSEAIVANNTAAGASDDMERWVL